VDTFKQETQTQPWNGDEAKIIFWEGTLPQFLRIVDEAHSRLVLVQNKKFAEGRGPRGGLSICTTTVK
jgi:hypothetical protein